MSYLHISIRAMSLTTIFVLAWAFVFAHCSAALAVGYPQNCCCAAPGACGTGSNETTPPCNGMVCPWAEGNVCQQVGFGGYMCGG
jgi:hypothetical protein